MKELNKCLKVGSANLRAADAELLYQNLGCQKGLINYFSIINDSQNKVQVIIDKVIMDAKYASFHPMDNTASTAIST